jgi:hypothetical protein
MSNPELFAAFYKKDKLGFDSTIVRLNSKKDA